MADNMVTLVGTLGSDPELRRTPQGKDVVNFSLVANERVRDAEGEWADGQASWFRITVWNRLGRNAAMSFRKGQRVIVRGALKVDQWQARDGGTAKSVVLTATSLGHDLLWGTSTFARGASSAPGPSRPAADEPQPPSGWAPAPEPGVAERETVPAAPAADWSSSLAAGEEVPF